MFKSVRNSVLDFLLEGFVANCRALIWCRVFSMILNSQRTNTMLIFTVVCGSV